MNSGTTTQHSACRVLEQHSWAIAALAAALLACCQRTDAQCSYTWDGDARSGTDGSAYAFTNWDPDGPGPKPELLVIGGGFWSAGDLLKERVVAFDGQSWHAIGDGLLTTSPSGVVTQLTNYNGTLIAGGSFQLTSDPNITGLAAWGTSGWTSFGGGLRNDPYEASVSAMCVYAGELYVAGSFTNAGGVLCNGFARWDGSVWHCIELAPSMTILAMIDYNGELVIAGDNGFRRWTGLEWEELGMLAGGPVRALAVYGSQLIAGGDFTIADTAHSRHVARYDGVWWRSMDGGIGYAWPATHVYGVTVWNGKVVVVGQFFNAGNVSSPNIALWSSSGWEAVPGERQDGTAIMCAAPYNGSLYVGGSFSLLDGFAAGSIARWDGSQWGRLGPGLDNQVHVLAAHDGALVAGGQFVVDGPTRLNRIAKRSGGSWQPLGAGFNYSVLDVTTYCGRLVAGGYFTMSGNAEVPKLATWDGELWQPVGGGVVGTSVEVLLADENELYVGGAFYSAGDVLVANIARWDGRSWHPLGSGVSGWVYALAKWRGRIYAGGDFGLGCWDGSEWRSVKPHPAGYVSDLLVHNDRLFVAGEFWVGSPADCAHVAAWDGSTWDDLGDPPFERVLSLAADGDDVIAGGVVLDGSYTLFCARYDGHTWRMIVPPFGGYDWAPQIEALIAFDGRIYAGGNFTQIGPQSIAFLAEGTPSWLVGDTNCDGVVDFVDIDPLVLAFQGEAAYLAVYPECVWLNGDADGDSDVDFFDIDLFVGLLGTTCP